MAKRKVNRIERIQNRFLDSMENTMGQWVARQVAEYSPNALDFAKGKIQTLPESLKRSMAEHKQKKVFKTNVFARGIKQGERQKEDAMIQGMKDAGLSDAQIESVLQQVQQKNETVKNKKPHLKVFHIKRKRSR